MLRHGHPMLTPTYSLDLSLLRRAGRFASPEGEEGGKPGDGGGKPDEGKPDGGKPEGEKPAEKPTDTAGRISVLVEERNAAQQEAAAHRATAERLQRELDQLKGNDQTGTIKELQKQISDLQTTTRTRFDKLLETELSNLPEAAAKAVKSIPGGSEAQFDWLVANRALFQGTGTQEQEKKGPDGQPSNDKKPPKGGEPGASGVAKGYVESRKPKKAGFPGLTG